MRVILTIEDRDPDGRDRRVRFTAEQNNGKFALGLVAQVVQAAITARSFELTAFKNLIDTFTPIFPYLKGALLSDGVHESEEVK